MIRLGVNIDHVATVRQARRGHEPDPVPAASLAMMAGADGITIHLREDRRHIQDRDLAILRETIPFGLNLEMACYADIIKIALHRRPDQITLVPEKRQELTTEGGLDVLGQYDVVKAAVEQFQEAGIPVALFIDADPGQIEASKRLNVRAIEFHTGQYAEAKGVEAIAKELATLRQGASLAASLGLNIHMGHGLNYHNVQAIVRIPGVEELNIGHSIVSRSIFVGMSQAVREMKQAMMEHYPNQRS